MKFNSQICTTREQSERLLSLGLKKETADMGIYYSELAGCDRMFAKIETEFEADEIPAWSLHRLWELDRIHDITLDSEDEIATLYDEVINNIEAQIKEGNFPKEYLVNLTGTDSHQDMVDAFGYAFEVMKAKKEE